MQDDWKERFGARLRMVRRLRDLKQEVVCSSIGITQGTLSRYEKGSSIPSYYHMFGFARVYKWPMSGFDPDRPWEPTPPDEDTPSV